MWITILLVYLLQLDASASRKLYDGFQVVRVEIETTKQLALARGLKSDDKLDFWPEPKSKGSVVEVLVDPDRRACFEGFLVQHNFHFTVKIENVATHLQQENERFARRRDAQGKMVFDFDDFNDYDAMIGQLEDFVGNCSDPFTCELQLIGTTYEGRPLHLLKVSTAPDDEGRKAVWMDSLIHAREWLAGTTTMNVINHMLTSYSTDDEVTYLLDKYNFYFLPVMNPDGYIHSWEVDRFWRKSRNVNNDSICMGTDLNRNYDQSWSSDGTSESPCSDVYHGSSAGSEPETQTISAKSTELSSELIAFISIHTAANMWLHPLGNTNEDGSCARSVDHDDQYQVAEAAANATMAAYDTTWTYGTTCETIYPAAGTTPDYTYGVAGIKYSYTPELRGPGFDPSPEAIDPGWREYWAGIKALIYEIEKIEQLP